MVQVNRDLLSFTALIAFCACVSCVSTTHSPAHSPARNPPEPVQVAETNMHRHCGMDVARLLADELAARPHLETQDAYQLIREAILGQELPLLDASAARGALERDLRNAGPPHAKERLVEDLDEVSGTVRINLRRWRFVKGTADELWTLILLSAKELGRNPERLAGCLDDAALALPAFHLDASLFSSFCAEQSKSSWPEVSHSEAYSNAYAPAYRIVLRRFLPAWVTAPPPTTG